MKLCKQSTKRAMIMEDSHYESKEVYQVQVQENTTHVNGADHVTSSINYENSLRPIKEQNLS